MPQPPSAAPACTALVVGASGGIGRALLERALADPRNARVLALSRRRPAGGLGRAEWLSLDYADEASIAAAAAEAAKGPPLRLALVATGTLQPGGRAPEKSFRNLGIEALVEAFRVNAAGPAMVAKHVLPLLPKDGRSVFAALSARVGSIGDNRMGGWHAYRASKAALNMMVRTLAVELARTRPEAVCVALHPGTVDTELSRPFQKGVPEGRLMTPAQSAERLMAVLDGLTPADSGGLFAWDGKPIPW